MREVTVFLHSQKIQSHASISHTIREWLDALRRRIGSGIFRLRGHGSAVNAVGRYYSDLRRTHFVGR